MRLSRAAVTTRKSPRAGRPAWKCAEEFKRWLRKLPCAACGRERAAFNPIEAAHVDHAGTKGMGTKTADRNCLPFCRECHIKQGAGWETFEKTLKGGDAVALSEAYWQDFPGRRQWEQDLAANPDGMRGAPRCLR